MHHAAERRDEKTASGQRRVKRKRPTFSVNQALHTYVHGLDKRGLALTHVAFSVDRKFYLTSKPFMLQRKLWKAKTKKNGSTRKTTTPKSQEATLHYITITRSFDYTEHEKRETGSERETPTLRK
mmetsp:Transcript_2822/g.5849  ORF Transcript_2822/g.5849 Transcript_2822/m.5849 type:complete len:125 (-) Transcript_2822:1452-1826(-)